MLAVFGIDHTGEEAARRIACAGAKLRDHARNAHGLQAGEFQGQRFTGGANVEQPAGDNRSSTTRTNSASRSSPIRRP